jgi:hypothetical protein
MEKALNIEKGARGALPVEKKEPELPPLSPEEIKRALISFTIEAKSKDAVEQIATLDALLEKGDLRLWGKTQAPQFKNTSISQLENEYKLSAQTLGLASGDDLDDLKWALLIVSVGSAVLAIGSGLVIGGNVGATFTYLFATVPIIFLGIGSTAPGLITAVIEVLKVRVDAKYGERRVKHEAAHFLMGYLCGVPIAGYDVESSLPTVELYDTRKGMLTGNPADLRITREEANGLSIVALAGAVAEVNTFGDAKGGQQDLELLNKILARCDPPLSPDQCQAQTRWAAAEAYRLLETYKKPFLALVEAIEAKQSVAECIAKLETAA